MTTVVGIDIGSNTFSVTKLRQKQNGIEIFKDVSLTVRLSEGMPASRELKPQAVYRGLEALKLIADEFDIKAGPARAVGTAVLRMASNKEVFVEPAREVLGTTIEILTGVEEARLVGKGSRFGLTVLGPSITADIGGQSTEILQTGVAKLPKPKSLPLGVVELTTRFFKTDPPESDAVKRLRAHVGGVLRATTPRDWQGELIGVAGTATTLALLELELTEWRREKVHGLEICRDRVQFWLDQMLAISADERTQKYKVRQGRADVFPAGLLILDECMSHFDRDRFRVSACGLRVGVALELLERLTCNLD